MFNFIKNNLQKIYTAVTQKFSAIFSVEKIDQKIVEELYELLIKSDVGVATTKKIIANIQNAYQKKNTLTGQDVQTIITQEFEAILTLPEKNQEQAQVYLLVGINGSGKTTLCGKLAHYFKQQGKSVMVVAADTFRAAAVEQLQQWVDQAGATLVMGKPGQDPASVVFQASQQFVKDNYDILIIDTAGRLQIKDHLMRELEKIKKIVNRQLSEYKICTLLTIDAMLGQNSFSQVKIFNEMTQLDGIVLTKLDGTAKGGIVFSIVQEFSIPIVFLSWGEHIQDITLFDSSKYIQNLLGQNSLYRSHKERL